MVNKLKWEDFEPKLGAWSRYFKKFFGSKVAYEMYQKIKEEAKNGTIYPSSSDTYRVFKESYPEDLKVVFILQDPYSEEFSFKKPQACGVAMDCRYGKILPTLNTFYEGMKENLGHDVDRSESLEYLVEQSILLLNSELTVTKDMPGSHSGIWKPFMEYFFKEVMIHFTGIVYVLMGTKSWELESLINSDANYIFKLNHPASSKHNGTNWDHKEIFTKINEILLSQGRSEIMWNRRDWAKFTENLPF